MKISDILKAKKPTFSFEFFPPKDEEGTQRLYETVEHLRDYTPDFVTITRTGTATQKLTLDLVCRIKSQIKIETAAHMTCVGLTRSETSDILDQIWDSGIENIVALRGDPPKGGTEFKPVDGGFAHGSDLIAFAKSRHPFSIAGAAYPEKHPEATSMDVDIDNLRTKVDAGCDFLITQLFFDNAHYFSLVERAQKAGITVPIVAGIMPITSSSQIKKFTGTLFGAKIPSSLLSKIEACGDDAEKVLAVGIEHALEQCQGLIANGVPGIHLYTLNRSHATVSILEQLRARP